MALNCAGVSGAHRRSARSWARVSSLASRRAIWRWPSGTGGATTSEAVGRERATSGPFPFSDGFGPSPQHPCHGPEGRLISDATEHVKRSNSRSARLPRDRSAVCSGAAHARHRRPQTKRAATGLPSGSFIGCCSGRGSCFHGRAACAGRRVAGDRTTRTAASQRAVPARCRHQRSTMSQQALGHTRRGSPAALSALRGEADRRGGPSYRRVVSGSWLLQLSDATCCRMRRWGRLRLTGVRRHDRAPYDASRSQRSFPEYAEIHAWPPAAPDQTRGRMLIGRATMRARSGASLRGTRVSARQHPNGDAGWRGTRAARTLQRV